MKIEMPTTTVTRDHLFLIFVKSSSRERKDNSNPIKEGTEYLDLWKTNNCKSICQGCFR